MSEQDNIKAVHADFEAFNARDQEAWHQGRAADFVSEQPGAPGPVNAEPN